MRRNNSSSLIRSASEAAIEETAADAGMDVAALRSNLRLYTASTSRPVSAINKYKKKVDNKKLSTSAKTLQLEGHGQVVPAFLVATGVSNVASARRSQSAQRARLPQLQTHTQPTCPSRQDSRSLHLPVSHTSGDNNHISENAVCTSPTLSDFTYGQSCVSSVPYNVSPNTIKEFYVGEEDHDDDSIEPFRELEPSILETKLPYKSSSDTPINNSYRPAILDLLLPLETVRSDTNTKQSRRSHSTSSPHKFRKSGVNYQTIHNVDTPHEKRHTWKSSITPLKSKYGEVGTKEKTRRPRTTIGMYRQNETKQLNDTNTDPTRHRSKVSNSKADRSDRPFTTTRPKSATSVHALGTYARQAMGNTRWKKAILNEWKDLDQHPDLIYPTRGAWATSEAVPSVAFQARKFASTVTHLEERLGRTKVFCETSNASRKEEHDANQRSSYSLLVAVAFDTLLQLKSIAPHCGGLIDEIAPILFQGIYNTDPAQADYEEVTSAQHTIKIQDESPKVSNPQTVFDPFISLPPLSVDQLYQQTTWQEVASVSHTRMVNAEYNLSLTKQHIKTLRGQNQDNQGRLLRAFYVYDRWHRLVERAVGRNKMHLARSGIMEQVHQIVLLKRRLQPTTENILDLFARVGESNSETRFRANWGENNGEEVSGPYQLKTVMALVRSAPSLRFEVLSELMRLKGSARSIAQSIWDGLMDQTAFDRSEILTWIVAQATQMCDTQLSYKLLDEILFLTTSKDACRRNTSDTSQSSNNTVALQSLGQVIANKDIETASNFNSYLLQSVLFQSDTYQHFSEQENTTMNTEIGQQMFDIIRPNLQSLISKHPQQSFLFISEALRMFHPSLYSLILSRAQIQKSNLFEMNEKNNQQESGKTFNLSKLQMTIKRDPIYLEQQNCFPIPFRGIWATFKETYENQDYTSYLSSSSMNDILMNANTLVNNLLIQLLSRFSGTFTNDLPNTARRTSRYSYYIQPLNVLRFYHLQNGYCTILECIRRELSTHTDNIALIQRDIVALSIAGDLAISLISPFPEVTMWYDKCTHSLISDVALPDLQIESSTVTETSTIGNAILPETILTLYNHQIQRTFSMGEFILFLCMDSRKYISTTDSDTQSMIMKTIISGLVQSPHISYVFLRIFSQLYQDGILSSISESKKVSNVIQLNDAIKYLDFLLIHVYNRHDKSFSTIKSGIPLDDDTFSLVQNWAIRCLRYSSHTSNTSQEDDQPRTVPVSSFFSMIQMIIAWCHSNALKQWQIIYDKVEKTLQDTTTNTPSQTSGGPTTTSSATQPILSKNQFLSMWSQITPIRSVNDDPHKAIATTLSDGFSESLYGFSPLETMSRTPSPVRARRATSTSINTRADISTDPSLHGDTLDSIESRIEIPAARLHTGPRSTTPSKQERRRYSTSSRPDSRASRRSDDANESNAKDSTMEVLSSMYNEYVACWKHMVELERQVKMSTDVDINERLHTTSAFAFGVTCIWFGLYPSIVSII